MKHLHWKIIAFEREKALPLESKQVMTGAVAITVTDAQDEAGAVEAARNILKRPYYKVVEVVECSVCDNSQDRNAIMRYMAASMDKHGAD